MKNLIFISLTLGFSLVSLDVFACGSAGSSTFTSSTDFNTSVREQKARLVCLSNGSYAKADFKAYAQYKCIGSPILAKIEFSDSEKYGVTSVQELDGKLLFSQVSGDGSIDCKLEPLSDEELQVIVDKKAEAERLRLERDRLEREDFEKKKAAIPASYHQKVDEALKARLLEGGRVVETILDGIYFSEESSYMKLYYTVTTEVIATGEKETYTVKATFYEGKLEGALDIY